MDKLKRSSLLSLEKVMKNSALPVMDMYFRVVRVAAIHYSYK